MAQRAHEVERFDASLIELVQDMKDTLRSVNGAGLAAPQIGISQRVVVFGLGRSPRYPNMPDIPETVLVNPRITFPDGEKETAWEGCLSVPGMRGEVTRPANVVYEGFDEHGHLFTREVSGFHTRVVQHECDHLDGVLYPARIHDLSRFGFISELEAAGLILPPDDKR